MAAARRKMPNRQTENDGDDGQRRHQTPIDETEHRDTADNRGGGRNGRPGKRVLDGKRGARRRADAPCKRARETVGEIARRVTRQMLEEIEPQIATELDKGARRDPAS